MANQTIPNLTAAVSLNGTEQLWAVQAGSDVKVTTTQLANFVNGGGVGSTFSVSVGGTGASSFTQYAIVYGNGTSALQTVTPPAGTNWVLVASPNSPPSWQPSSVVIAGVSSLNTGTTGLLVGNDAGQSPVGNTPVSGNTTLSGTLAVANGGTGATTSTGSGSVVLQTAPNLLNPKINGYGITIGGAFTVSGAFSATLTVTGNTSVTLPTSGTLTTLASVISYLTSLPTTLPGTSGQLWNNGGVISIS